MDEFTAYVKKRNPKAHDQEEVLKEFKQIDLNQDGQIQFLEFLQAICLKEGILMPNNLSTLDKLRIYEIIEFRHISADEKIQILQEISQIQGQIRHSTCNSSASLKSGAANSSSSSNMVMGSMVVAALGAASFFAVKHFNNWK